MSTGASGSSGGHPRRRLFALALLLVLSLTLAGALALQAIATARRHRETAQRTLQDYAAFGAFILASQSYRQLGGAVVESFTGWPARGGPTVPAGADCPGGTAHFQQPPGTASPRLAGSPVAAADLVALTDTLRHAMRLLKEVGWRFRFLRVPAGEADGWFITSYMAPGGGYGLRGFTACLGGPDSPFRRVALTERALPPAVTGRLPADSLFSTRVTGGGGRVLYRSPRVYSSPYHASAQLGTEFGDLSLGLTLRPDVAGRLVIGGIPAPPTPLALGLLGLSTLLVVTALLQLRREYELIAIRSDFVSNVSHELRTPLSQILIFTELLKLGRLRSDAERERSLDIIHQEVRRLIRLVENVLQFARSGAGRRRLERDRVPLAGLIGETLDAFRPLAASRDVTLLAEVPEQAAVRADPSALRQILLNLLDNAVKYGPRGQTVRVAAAVLNGRTRIAVDDQGPGIPLADRHRVWQGYYRLQRETRSAVAGSGIGLAVVRSLASEMSGRTWVEDTETGGARFVVELASSNGGRP
ncbi:MAG TPA: HAMP domain-containing sensor histidine kinase [Gemmatimonadales bacterium]